MSQKYHFPSLASPENKLFLLSLISYLIISCYLYLQFNVMVFDEAWFTCCFSAENFTNQLAYGYLYWLFINTIQYKLVLRLIALLSMLSIPIILYKFSQKFKIERNKLIWVILLWLTYPAAWWFGKLVAPELYCLALGFWGLYLACPPEKSTRWKNLGLLLMGVATGIKLTFIIFPLFYYSYRFFILLTNKRDHKNTIKEFFHYFFLEEKLGLFLIIGFLVGSPSLIFKPSLYFKHLLQFSSSTLELWHLKYLYSPSVGDFWETVIMPSLTWFSLSIPTIVFLIISSKKFSLENKPLFWSFLVSLLASLALLIKSAGFCSWYFYPIIVLSLLLFLTIDASKKYFFTIILINFLANSPVIFSQITDKFMHVSTHKHQTEISNYIDKQLANFKKQYKNTAQYTSFRPETGSGILGLNSHLIGGIPFKKPTFFAVSKIMMVSHGNHSSIYSHIAETFNDNRIKRFKKAVFSLSKEKYKISYLGNYRDVYSFTVVPKKFIKK